MNRRPPACHDAFAHAKRPSRVCQHSSPLQLLQVFCSVLAHFVSGDIRHNASELSPFYVLVVIRNNDWRIKRGQVTNPQQASGYVADGERRGRAAEEVEIGALNAAVAVDVRLITAERGVVIDELFEQLPVGRVDHDPFLIEGCIPGLAGAVAVGLFHSPPVQAIVFVLRACRYVDATLPGDLYAVLIFHRTAYHASSPRGLQGARAYMFRGVTLFTDAIQDLIPPVFLGRYNSEHVQRRYF